MNDSTFCLACLLIAFSNSFLFHVLRPSTRVTLSNQTVSTLSAYDYKEMFVQNKLMMRKCFVISNGILGLGGNCECFCKTGKVQYFTTVAMEDSTGTVCTSCSSVLMPNVQWLLLRGLLWVTSGCQRNLQARHLLLSCFLNCDAGTRALLVWHCRESKTIAESYKAVSTEWADQTNTPPPKTTITSPLGWVEGHNVMRILCSIPVGKEEHKMLHC